MSGATRASTEGSTSDLPEEPSFEAIPQDRSFEALFGPNRVYPYFEHAKDYPFDAAAGAFSRVNAWWLAEASMLVYVNDTEFTEQKLAKAGLGNVRTYSSPANSGHHTQALIASNKTFAIVALRGTEPDEPKDLLTDLNFLQVGSEDGGKVHLGFKAALDDIWEDMKPALERLNNGQRTIWFTGHSLGAALAVLAADRFGEAAGVYTFGSPRVGDAGFRSEYRQPTYRIVNNIDLVTELPPPAFYLHVGDLKYFGSDGRLREGIAAFAWLQDRAKSRVEATLSRVGEWATLRFDALLPKDLEDHAPIHYVKSCWNELIEAER